MTTFVCRNCGYRIASEKRKACPYCGENELEKEKTAEELLRETDID